MVRKYLCLCGCLLLTACDAVDDMKGMFEKQNQAQEYVKKTYGWDSQLGFNISNGTLTQATLIVNASQVGQLTVDELNGAAVDTIAHVFKSEPKAIYIQIVANTQPDQAGNTD